MEQVKRPQEFNQWQSLALRHWKEYLPQMYAELVKEKRLEAELYKACELTWREMQAKMAEGATWDEAWEASRELYLLLPPEPETDEEPMPESEAFNASQEMVDAMQEQPETMPDKSE